MLPEMLSEFSRAPVYGGSYYSYKFSEPNMILPIPVPLWPPTSDYNDFIESQLRMWRSNNEDPFYIENFTLESEIQELFAWRLDWRPGRDEDVDVP